MNLRKTAGLLAVAGIVVGLLGSGVGASFIDQVTGTESISVGSFACQIISGDGTIGNSPHAGSTITYTAPQITSSAAGNAPFSFTVQNTGSIAQALTVSKTGQTGNLSVKFSDMPASVSPASLAPGATAVVSTGIQWTTLDNSDLTRSGSMTWTVSCNEAAAVIFDNTPAVLPGNLASFGVEAYYFNEWGAGSNFAGTARKLSTATVTMSDWACQSGGWNTNDCVTTPGATFPVNITFKVYNVGPSNSVGSVVATKTQTFNIPYRPSKDAVNCIGANAGKWYNGTTCFNGFANNIVFTFAGESLPNSAIFGISYNTSTNGYSPEGPGSHPEDSLNIATMPGTGVVTAPSVGTWLPDGSHGYVSPNLPPGPFAGPATQFPGGDTFAGYMPAVQITANN